LSKNKIIVFGGDQTRPNIHIDDITDLYVFLLKNPQIIGIFNAGFENISILDIAKTVTKHVPVEIVITESNDPRSYRVNSDKLLATGFRPKKSVEHAVREIIEAFNKGELKDEERFYNLRWMEKANLAF
jgi:nucleoside-diphosphate-sugar epimerase